MDNYLNFQPKDEEVKQWIELYNNLSKFASETIRGLPKKARLQVLKDSKPSDLSLMNLYLQAMKKEDYETCAAAKALLLERGHEIPG